jgi:hypothetical protein
MKPAPALILRWRQALIDMIGPGGFIALYSVAVSTDGVAPDSGLIVRIPLATPAGSVDDAGIAISITGYGQVTVSGDVVSARIERQDGDWCGNVTTGLAGDVPTPELVLPALTFRSGAFVRLTGSRIDIAYPAI